MKFQNIIRQSLLFAGITAALIFPATVRSQEITNTPFPDGPNVAPLVQPAPVDQQAASLPAPQAIKASEAITASAQPQQEGMVQVSTPTWLSTSMFIGVAAIALYALAEAKRANRNLAASRSSYFYSRSV